MTSITHCGNSIDSIVQRNISELTITQKNLYSQISELTKRIHTIEQSITGLQQKITELEPKQYTTLIPKDEIYYDPTISQPELAIAKESSNFVTEYYGLCEILVVKINYISQLEMLKNFYMKNSLSPVITPNMEPLPINHPDSPFAVLNIGSLVLLPYNEKFAQEYLATNIRSLFL